jgi:methylated-DNA-[protein]-cysteine S-methyltransferase
LLERYFAGEPVDPVAIPVDLHGTEFQRKVWTALRQIPRGRVRTYQGVGADVGSPRAMRAVGMANSKNPIPIVVPCHRVVEVGNRLGGYTSGIERKIRLLELEGVKVEGDLVLPGQLGLL